MPRGRPGGGARGPEDPRADRRDHPAVRDLCLRLGPVVVLEPAPVRRFPPELIDLIWNRQIDPGKVFDLTLPLDETAEGYRAIKTLLRP
jgi:hypothetical protein